MKAPNNSSAAVSSGPSGSFKGGPNSAPFQNSSTQSVLTMDESIPYSRVVEKSDLYLGGFSCSVLIIQ